MCIDYDDMQFWGFLFSKTEDMRSRVGQNKFGENGFCRNYLIKQSFCHTFPVIPKAQNYRECMEQYLGVPKNRYRVQFISVVNLNLFVWFIKAKVYKVES